MPNGMDLAEITQWWNESTLFATGGTAISRVAPFASGKVTYTFNNIFVQAPTQMCPGSEERPDTNIKITLNTPANAASISSPFTVAYSIIAPKNIRRVLILLNKQQVGMYEYPQ